VKLADGSSKAYGFGWHTDVLHGHQVVFHGGAWQGFKSFIVRFPKERITFIFMANQWETKDFGFARGLVATQFPEFSLSGVTPIADKEGGTTTMIRRMLLHVAQGTTPPDSFTAAGASRFFPEQAKQVGKLLNTLSLPIALIFTSELVERKDENGLRVYRYALTDVGKTIFCTVRLGSGDKLESLSCNQAAN